jgi:hypothetical protein
MTQALIKLAMTIASATADSIPRARLASFDKIIKNTFRGFPCNSSLKTSPDMYSPTSPNFLLDAVTCVDNARYNFRNFTLPLLDTQPRAHSTHDLAAW